MAHLFSFRFNKRKRKVKKMVPETITFPVEVRSEPGPLGFGDGEYDDNDSLLDGEFPPPLSRNRSLRRPSLDLKDLTSPPSKAGDAGGDNSTISTSIRQPTAGSSTWFSSSLASWENGTTTTMGGARGELLPANIKQVRMDDGEETEEHQVPPNSDDMETEPVHFSDNNNNNTPKPPNAPKNSNYSSRKVFFKQGPSVGSYYLLPRKSPTKGVRISKSKLDQLVEI